jgi:hypothetical protein
MITTFNEYSKIFESTGFTKDELNSIKSFSGKIAYCEKNLTRLSSGSSRIVYVIDEKSVLKLAKNKKGLDQNYNEISYSDDAYFGNIFAKVLDSPYESNNEDSSWLIMEFAKKLSLNDFKKILGYSFKDYSTFIQNFEIKHHPSKYRGMSVSKIDDDVYEILVEDSFANDITAFMDSTNCSYGDLVRISSYGIVNGNIVLIDYGLTGEIFDTHYKRK